MTRADLAEKVAKAVKVPRKNAKIIVDVLFEKIVDALKKGEKVEFRGFGTFSIDIGSPSAGAIGCATVPFTGALTTDRVLATPLTIPTNYMVNLSAQISAADTLQVCMRNTSILAVNPSALDVFVAVYIP